MGRSACIDPAGFGHNGAMGLGVSVGLLRHGEHARPRFLRLRRARNALREIFDPVTVHDFDLYFYESATSSTLADAVNRALTDAGHRPFREPPARGRSRVSFDLPSDGLGRLNGRLPEPLVDVYLPIELNEVLQGDGIRIASTASLQAACERAAAALGALPDPGDDPSELEPEDGERYVCAALLAAAQASLRHRAAVVIN
jgi:hypothetical protein